MVCPPVVEYSLAIQAQAAAELELLPPDSAIDQLLRDYHVMRVQALACKSAGGTVGGG